MSGKRAYDDECEKTRVLFMRITQSEAKWSPTRQMVANVFNAYPTRALSVKQIIAVAKAVEGLSPNGDNAVQDALTFYVRHKVLRRRKTSGGASLYEVNF